MNSLPGLKREAIVRVRSVRVGVGVGVGVVQLRCCGCLSHGRRGEAAQKETLAAVYGRWCGEMRWRASGMLGHAGLQRARGQSNRLGARWTTADGETSDCPELKTSRIMAALSVEKEDEPAQKKRVAPSLACDGRHGPRTRSWRGAENQLPQTYAPAAFQDALPARHDAGWSAFFSLCGARRWA